MLLASIVPQFMLIASKDVEIIAVEHSNSDVFTDVKLPVIPSIYKISALSDIKLVKSKVVAFR